MKIGTVVNVRITGAVRTCLVIDSKSSSVLNCTWNDTLKYLREIYTHIGLFVHTDPFFPAVFWGSHGGVICYELMYGDKKVWIRDGTLEEHGEVI